MGGRGDNSLLCGRCVFNKGHGLCRAREGVDLVTGVGVREGRRKQLWSSQTALHGWAGCSYIAKGSATSWTDGNSFHPSFKII